MRAKQIKPGQKDIKVQLTLDRKEALALQRVLVLIQGEKLKHMLKDGYGTTYSHKVKKDMRIKDEMRFIIDEAVVALDEVLNQGETDYGFT